jgi:L-rhamnose-H+ transport protein
MLGFLVAIVAGLVQGSFTLPMKYTGKWKWEHTWSMWSVWALIIVPWIIGLATVPHPFKVYREVDSGPLLLTFGISLAWGIGAITFGMGVERVGMALGFAIIMGLSVALGSLIPLFMQPEKAFSRTGLLIVAGVVVMMVGIAIGAKAAMLKEQALAAGSKLQRGMHASMVKGLLICILAGVCGALMNVAFVVGQPIQDKAHELGASLTSAPNAVWCIALLGGFIVNFGYCCYLMRRNQNWATFRAAGSGGNWILSAAMGLMWMGSLAIYGVCSALMGPLGKAMGFAVFLGIAIVTGNLWGVATGEWRGSGRKPLLWMAVSVVVLLMGMGLIAWSKAPTSG